MSRQQGEAAPRARPGLVALDRWAADHDLPRLWRDGDARSAGAFDPDAHAAVLRHWRVAQIKITVSGAST